MLEYLVRKLSAGGEQVTPFAKKLVDDRLSHYLKTEQKGLVFLCDRPYTKQHFARLAKSAKKQFENVAIVFLKDSTTYFRTALPQAYFKADGRSLKEYTIEDLKRIMHLRPEEIYCVYHSAKGTLQYYQPKSHQQNEGIVQYTYDTILFDYSHISEERFQPRNACSKRLHQWKDKKEHTGPLTLDKRSLLFLPEQKSLHACIDCRYQ